MSRVCMQLDEMTQKKLAKQLALQCAPLLAGIKISNIFIVSTAEEASVKALFQDSIISYEVLFKCKRRVVFFLYHKKRLQNHLRGAKQCRIMQQLGYEESHLEGILKQLADRYKCYMSFKEQFPHELGILLGYPHEDVEAFIENEGKDCLCTGYWKVYSNINRAQSIFKAYNQAKEQILQMVMSGMSIAAIIQRHYVVNKKQPA